MASSTSHATIANMSTTASTNAITTRQRKALIEKISQLTETEHQEIYKMLNDVIKSNDGVGFTQNRNGVFLNFKKVPPETVIQIEKFVDFCNSNRPDLDEYDKRIKECKLNKDISKVIQYNNVNNNITVSVSGDGASTSTGITATNSGALQQLKHSQDTQQHSIISPQAPPTTNSLQDVISRENKNHAKKTEWLDVLKECKEKERVSHYVDSLENNFSKIHKKKTCNMKYANAKKKYARRIVTEKKFDADLVSNLELESYL